MMAIVVDGIVNDSAKVATCYEDVVSAVDQAESRRHLH